MLSSCISVALCTYNGEKYIEEQLNSILQQTLPVQQIVIVDDGSTDDTISIIKRYQEQYPSIIQLYLNEQNLGYVRNFEKALSLCTSDIIFLSDQDDKWLSHKTQRVIEVFQQNPEAGAIFCDAIVMNQESIPLDYSIWETIAFKHRFDLQQSNELLYDYVLKTYNVVTGCCFAIKKASLNKLIPFKFPYADIHDLYLPLAVAVVSKNQLVALNECLGFYRMHDKQTVGIPTRQQWEELETEKDRRYKYFYQSTGNAFDDMFRVWVYYRSLQFYKAVFPSNSNNLQTAFSCFLEYKKLYLKELSFFNKMKTLVSWTKNKRYAITLKDFF